MIHSIKKCIKARCCHGKIMKEKRCLLAIMVFLSCGAASARIQVLALQDGRGTQRGTGAPALLTDSFCVVSSRGSVKLTFKNSNGGDAPARAWRAVNAAGQSVRYQQYVAITGDPVPTIISDASTASITVPAEKAAASPAACGTGNVLKGVNALDAISPRSPFIDIVTVVATPL